MRLFEYEAKRIFQQAGIPVPRSGCARDPKEAAQIAEQIHGPVVIKPQTLAKARGKAGLIRFANDPQAALELSEWLFSQSHDGEVIKTLLIEERIPVLSELFLGATVEYSKAAPVLIVSPEGGMDVETAARERPGSVRFSRVSPTRGLLPEQLSDLVRFLCEGRPEVQGRRLSSTLEVVIRNFCQIFHAYDCELAEINPLGIREDFSLVALDGLVIIDDEAQFRHPELVRPRNQSMEDFQREQDLKKRGWTYIQLEGDIGILSSGAGITMAILDLIHLNGGRPANFLDTAQMNRQGIYDALRMFHQSSDIKVLLVNIFAGLNRCDELAEGISDYLREFKAPFPLVVRMIGNRDREGREILEAIGITPIAGLEEAVDRAVSLARRCP